MKRKQTTILAASIKMNTLIFLLVLLFRGSLSQQIPQMDLTTTDECLNVKNGPYTCSPDCTSLIYCISGRMVSVDCSQLTGGKRTFCNAETMQCTDNYEGKTCINEENCQLGFYPDLINCKKYAFCDGAHMYYYECKNRTLFDSKTAKCQLDTKMKCYSFSTTNLCRGRVGFPVEYPPNNHKYVFCLPFGPVLMSCGIREIFYKDSCIFDCQEPGYFVDWKNERNYYECKYDVYRKIILPLRKKCEPDFIFSEYLEQCIKKPNVRHETSADIENFV